MGQLCALRIAGYEPDAAFARGLRLVSKACISHAPFRPPGPGFTAAVQQAKNDRSARYRLGWHGGQPLDFLHSAESLPHPANDDVDDFPGDLLDAAAFIVSKRERIISWRDKRVELLQDVAASLRPLNDRMLDDVRRLRPHVHFVVRGYNLAFMALVVNATHEPDVFLVRRFLYGFPVYGELPTAHVYNLGGEPPRLPAKAVFNTHNNKVWNSHSKLTWQVTWQVTRYLQVRIYFRK